MKKIVSLLLITLILLNTETTFAGILLNLQESVEIGGEYITIGDIARIESQDKKLKEKISSLIITRSPHPGVSISLRELEVKACLKKNYIKEEVKIQGSELVKITTRALRLKGAEIIKQATDFILLRLPWEKENVKIESLNYPADMILREGVVSFEVNPATKNYFVGQVVLLVSIYLDGQLYKKVPVNLRIRVFEKVVVIQRNIGRKEIINKRDLQLARREITKIAGTPLRNIAEAINKVVKNRIKAQTVLTKEIIQPPVIIKRGSIVNIILKFKNLQVTARGLAKKDGRRGDFILIKNLDTKKELYGEVIGEGIVQIGL